MCLIFVIALSTCLPFGSSFHPILLSFRKKSFPFHLAPQQLGEFEPLQSMKASKRKVLLLNQLDDRPVMFEQAWDLQKSLHERQIGRLTDLPHESQFLDDDPGNRSGKDTVIFLEHEPVYTLGTGSDENFIISKNITIPVVRMDRGGEVTYHGPGQLTIYPILDLRGYKQDIHWYIRALEEVVIRTLSRYGLKGERLNGITGVWIDGFKVAAVGVKCKKWVTMHGLAINVDESSLDLFNGIVPCGLAGRKVGCVNQFLSKKVQVSVFAEAVESALEDVFEIHLHPSQTVPQIFNCL